MTPDTIIFIAGICVGTLIGMMIVILLNGSLLRAQSAHMRAQSALLQSQNELLQAVVESLTGRKK